jgi:hypothetical protein
MPETVAWRVAEPAGSSWIKKLSPIFNGVRPPPSMQIVNGGGGVLGHFKSEGHRGNTQQNIATSAIIVHVD